MEKRLKVQVWIWAQGSETERPQVLLLKLKPSRGGFWQPVTGGVDPGEALETAALREATEETALSFSAAPASLEHSFSFEGQRDGKTVQFTESTFALQVRGAPGQNLPRLDPHEHVDFRWVSPKDALKLLHFESNRETLRLLISRQGWSRDVRD